MPFYFYARKEIDYMYQSLNLDRLNRYKDEIDNMIKNCQGQQNPINNFINTNQAPLRDLIEWRVLNENEEVDNLYVQNKTLFINDNLMVLKGVDGSLEKWEIKKIYPIDKKDEKINELEEEIRKLKEMVNNGYKQSNSTVREFEQSDANVNVNVESKSKTSSKPISRKD